MKRTRAAGQQDRRGEPARKAPDFQTAMRQAIAAAMARSNRDIPHYYLETQIDMTKALKWLEEENQKRTIKDRLLPVVIMLKAEARALTERAGDDPEAHRLAAAVYGASGRFDEARAEYEVVQRLRSDDVDSAINLARIDLLQGKTADAARRFDQVLSTATGAAPRNYENPNNRLQFDNVFSHTATAAGTHSIKVGLQFSRIFYRERITANNDTRQLEFSNGNPVRIVVSNTPVDARNYIRQLGFFAQDSWSAGPLTLNIGVDKANAIHASGKTLKVDGTVRRLRYSKWEQGPVGGGPMMGKTHFPTPDDLTPIDVPREW